MATEIIKRETIQLFDGTEIELSPLKIFYLRELMSAFEFMKNAENEMEIISVLAECSRIAMKQFYPSLSGSVDDVEDNMDLKTIYRILDIGAGIKFNQDSEEVKQEEPKEGSDWKDLDLAKIESEVFLLGAWKNYDELEKTMSIPEVVITLGAGRELDYQEKKFLAAIQGVDLEEASGQKAEPDAWEKMKSRILYNGKDANDITNLTGKRAIAAGFGIGMGMEYEEVIA
jgi:hypothetical protein